MQRNRLYCSAFPSQCISLKEHKALKTLRYFPFPKTQSLFEEWAEASQRSDLLKNGATYAQNNCQLCELHFVDDFFKNDIHNINSLKKNAIPTIFGEVACRKNIDRTVRGNQDVEPPTPFATILLDEEIKTEVLDESIIEEPALTEMMIATSMPVDSKHSSHLVNVIKMATEAASEVSSSKTPKAAKKPLVTREATKAGSDGSQRINLVKKNIKLRKEIEENEAIMEQLRRDYKKISNDFLNYKKISSGLDDY